MVMNAGTLKVIQHIEKKTKQQLSYHCKELIGRGGYGCVYKAYLDDDENLIYAIKQIPKPSNLQNKRKLKREFTILIDFTNSPLSIPNIVKLHGYAKSENYYYLIQEYCNKSNLAVYIEKNEIGEAEAQYITREIVHTMKEFWGRGYLHRDLKPQNILLHMPEEESKYPIVKISDFGESRGVAGDLELEAALTTEGIGTKCYQAPEIFQGFNYSLKVDIWGIGVILLSFFDPRVRKGEYRFSHSKQIILPEYISEDCATFLKGCLQPYHENRFTREDILAHPFVQTVEADLGNIGLAKELGLAKHYIS